MKVRGRVWLGLWLLFFLLVALTVVARQRGALQTAARLNRLRTERMALEAVQAELERRIREGQSRQVLVPKVEARLGLREPDDSEYVIFAVPAVPTGAALPDSGR